MKPTFAKSARSVARLLVSRALATAGPEQGPFISGRDSIRGLERASIAASARLNVVVSESAFPDNSISLGKGVYIGRHAEVTASRGIVEIDDDTSLQDFDLVYGDIRIGAHCLFAPHVLVLSTSHRFRDRPAWLIRDQDAYFADHPHEGVDPPSRRVWIEDDCWIGWCAVVLPGVYIGRGAMIGANCVVTRDVGPYEVHGGVPNQRLSVRLEFRPPAVISALDDASIPYFYRGFNVRQDALRTSRHAGLVFARRKACIILSGTSGGGGIRISGQHLGREDLRLSVCINGADGREHLVPPGSFEIVEPISQAAPADGSGVPAPLASHTYIELSAATPTEDTPIFGIVRAALC